MHRPTTVIASFGARELLDTGNAPHRARKVCESPGGLNLVVLHHTDCGITRLARVPDRLAAYLGVAPDGLESKAVSDPYAAIRADVATLKETPTLPGGILISGLVYDVATGRLNTVVAPAPLR